MNHPLAAGHGFRAELPGNWQRVADAWRSGTFHTARYPDTVVGRPVDWALDPHDSSWLFRFHNLDVLYALARATEAGDDAAAPLLAETISSWEAAHPVPNVETPPWARHTTALRAQALARVVGLVPDELLRPALERHALFLADPAHYSGPWNHGFDESLALMAVGGALGDAKAVDLGVERASAAVAIMCDEQGATNEQASVYHFYVWKLFGQFEQELRLCGRDIPAVMSRRAAIVDFLTHASLPNGQLVQIGDSLDTGVPLLAGTSLEYCRSAGQNGPKPSRRVEVFERGWAFARSGWGEERDFSDESVMGLRFGPGRAVHGHSDHTSVFLFARGRMVVNDAGFSGYADPERRAYELNEYGHSQVVVAGSPYRATVSTRLESRVEARGMVAFSLADEPYAGVVRRRHVLYLPALDGVVVHDVVRVPPAAIVRQLWHAGTSLAPTAEANQVRLSDDRGVHVLTQLMPVTNIDVAHGVKGSKTVGWAGTGLGRFAPAAVVTSRTSTDTEGLARYLTAILPDDVGARWEEGAVHVGAERIGVDDRGFDLR